VTVVKLVDSTGRVSQASSLPLVRVFNARNICSRNPPIGRVYENEVESVKYAKRARQIGTDDCERSGRPTGANTPGTMIRVENAVFENRILAISELQQDLVCRLERLSGSYKG